MRINHSNPLVDNKKMYCPIFSGVCILNTSIISILSFNQHFVSLVYTNHRYLPYIYALIPQV